MHDTLLYVLPWVLSALTATTNFMAGSKHPKTWLVGIATQAGWTVWTLALGPVGYGLLPLNALLWAIYIRNHFRWRSDHAQRP